MNTLDDKAAKLRQPSAEPASEPGFELFCPFPSALHRDVDVVQAQSVAWARRFHLLGTSERKYRALDEAQVARLVARSFPAADRDGLQLAADWTTLFCLIDDKTEVAGTSMVRLAALLSRLIDAFREGNAGDDAFASALVDLRGRMLDAAGEAWLEQFGELLEKLFSAFLWENLNRSNHIRPSLSAYVTMRETTVGLHPQFALAEITDHVHLSTATLAHPTVRSLTTMACNVVGWTNDLFTYPKELAQGEVHNLVLLHMHEAGLTLDEALVRVVANHDAEMRAFIALAARLPDVGDERPQLLRYVGVLRGWMRGHLDWARETGRYRVTSTLDGKRAAHA
jgi:5-epi-alpha-selinene synthase